VQGAHAWHRARLAKQGGFARLTNKPDWRDERRAVGPPKIDLSESLGTLTMHKNYQCITRRRSTKTEKNRRDDCDVPPHSELGLCRKNVRAECNNNRR
jgi:hypothetical protein